jgi:enoyl-CoA hydratase
MSNEIVFTQERHIGLVTLQRVHALNALTLPMIISLQEQLHAWKNDNDIHAVVVQAAPGKAFCAGGDVRWLYDMGRSHNPQQMQFFWHEYRLNHFIHHFGKPYIALMDGVTMGGGVGISLHGSHPVASERFLFAMPETGIGFFPDIGASYLLSRCSGEFGVYLGLTGARLGAADAYELGLVKQIVPSENFQNVLVSLIETDLSPDAHASVDSCLKRYAMPAQPVSIINMQPAVNGCFKHNNIESIMEALVERDDSWSKEIANTLQKKAPLSLKVTLAQMQKAKSMSMADCIKMDYCLVGHFMQDHDFYEGVRALLVDKDKSPHWHPNVFSQVSNAMIADYFECGKPDLPLFT